MTGNFLENIILFDWSTNNQRPNVLYIHSAFGFTWATKATDVSGTEWLIIDLGLIKKANVHTNPLCYHNYYLIS